MVVLALLLVAAGLVAVALTRQPQQVAARKRAEAQRDRMANGIREIYAQATQMTAVNDPFAAYVRSAVEACLTDEERIQLDVR